LAGIEFDSITTIIFFGTFVGGGVVWAGLGPLMANHLWSAADAYQGAQVKEDPVVQQQLAEAKKTLELSRQSRLDHAQEYHSDLRSRIMQAGQLAR
jgi:hypothetical protein